MHRRLGLVALTVALSFGAAGVSAQPPIRALALDAPIDDQPLGPIGTGGAALGQPTIVPEGLTADVVPSTLGGHSLAITTVGTTWTTRTVTFEMLDGEILTSGLVVIEVRVTPLERDNFHIYPSPHTGNVNTWGSVRLWSSGSLQIFGGRESESLSAYYDAGQTIDIRFEYDLDAGMMRVLIDGVERFAERPIEADPTQGIRRVRVGAQVGTGYSGETILLDSLRVERDVALVDLVLDADFEDQPAGPIGAGGALSQPTNVSSGIETDIVFTLGGRSPRLLRATRDATDTSAHSIRWAFLEDVEVTRGFLLIELALRPNEASGTTLNVRERGSDGRSFTNLFFNGGSIRHGDAAGGPGTTVIGTFTEGQWIELALLYDMDAGAYDIYVDGEALLEGRAHGIEDRGIGTLLTGFGSSVPNGNSFYLDDIRVSGSAIAGLPAAATFSVEPSNVAVGASISPAVRVAVTDAFGAPAEDGFPIGLTHVGGSADATLSGGEVVGLVGGEVVFDSLSLDRIATGYQLRARTPNTEISGASYVLADSETFAVTAGPPASIAIEVQPSDALTNTSLSPGVRVRVEDALGNDVGDGTPVTLTIIEGPAGGTLSGASATTSGGLATFNNVRLSRGGTYRLRVSAGSASVDTVSFVIGAALGAMCSGDATCTSGHCVDGYCCDGACTGQCEACDRAGELGTCGAVTGSPRGGRTACAGSGVCAGTCDGVLTTGCAFPGAGVSCRDASCSGAEAIVGASCDGAGSCPAVQTQACAPFECSGSMCGGDCTASTDCAAGNFCSAGVCISVRELGVGCALDEECASGQCVDGFCCDTACEGQCEACDNAGSLGTCAPVSGAPHGGRDTCASDGSACGGSCDGTNGDACTYPSESQSCGEASCADGQATASGACDGAGACAEGGLTACAPFVCGVSACLESCAGASDCVEGLVCVDGVCDEAAPDMPDGGMPDGGVSDGGAADGGVLDAGGDVLDAGISSDASFGDAGEAPLDEAGCACRATGAGRSGPPSPLLGLGLLALIARRRRARR